MEAQEFPKLWVNAVNSGDIQSVLALYAEQATLLPTFSSKIIANAEGLASYFAHLASKPGLSVSLDEASIFCDSVGKDSYIIGGFYSFNYEANGTTEYNPSRFTFVVDLSKDRPLLHHHSSEVPS